MVYQNSVSLVEMLCTLEKMNPLSHQSIGTCETKLQPPVACCLTLSSDQRLITDYGSTCRWVHI